MNADKGRYTAQSKRSRYIQVAFAILGLILLFLAVQWLVKIYQKPGHMGVLESQTMSMVVQPPAGAMPVQTETVQLRSFSPSVTYTGNAVAYNEIAIYPRVEGRIIAMPVYPGDHVQAGQLLAQLDTRELSNKVQEAQAGQTAALQQYYASLRQQGQASAQMQRAQQAIIAAKANLQYKQEQVRRSRTLVTEDVITREEAQRDESDYAGALSQYQQAQSELKATQQGASASAFQSKAQRSQAAQAAAGAKTQQIIQSYTRITAPANGVITQRMVSPGTLVSPGMQILQVSQIHPIRIQANVAESDLQNLRLGSLVSIWAQKDQSKNPILGKVTAIFPKAELQTRTSVVEAVINNPDAHFIPGDFVTVSIQTGQIQKVLTVSTRALIDQSQQQAVWTVIEGKAHLQFVTTGGTDGNRTVIASGLKPGSTVITQGNQTLTEGAMVAQADYGPQGLKSLPQVTSINRLSKETQYQIRKTVGMYVATVALSNPPLRMGKNTLAIDVVSGPAMSMPTGNISVDLSVVMPSMASMPVPQPTVRKTGDGHFQADTMLEMPGLWQLTVTLKEGGQPLASFPVEIEAPQ